MLWTLKYQDGARRRQPVSLAALTTSCILVSFMDILIPTAGHKEKGRALRAALVYSASRQSYMLLTTPTTLPRTDTSFAATMIGCIVAFSGWRRTMSPSM